MSVLPLYAEDYTQTAIFVWNTLFSFLKVLAFRGSRDNRFPLRSGASHECRNNFLWGGHPEYTLALTGNTSCPTRKCICTIGMLPLDRGQTVSHPIEKSYIVNYIYNPKF